MLTETPNVRQVENEHFRRWFTDEFFDLIVWIDDTGVISGFQLCYDVGRNERALTWKRDHGYHHNGVDSGEDGPGIGKMTPILVADGEFNRHTIVSRFIAEAIEIDPDIYEFVVEKLREYIAE